jgi:F-box interacting protein
MSCRGLILLLRRPDIFCIWNPSTGFKKQIPFSPFDLKKVEILHARLYGFGYDESKDDYLVVLLSHEPTKENPFKSHFEIFSIRDNRWKVIEGTHFPYFGDREGLLLHRAIHWLTFRVDQEIYVIIAFDLMERKLFEIPLPDHFNQEEYFNQEEQPIAFGLWIFGEFLSLWAKNYDDTDEIWVMKEYTLKSSWTKTLVLPRNFIPNFYFSPICSTNNRYIPNFYFSPICSTDNGDIIGTICSIPDIYFNPICPINNDDLLFWNNNDDIIEKVRDTRLMKINDKGQLLRRHSFRNNLSDIVMYTESLLSLPGDKSL